MENDPMEKIISENLYFPAFLDMFKCVFCITISYTTSTFNNFVKRMNNMFTPEKTYRYKPPPSLFETLAIFTGALREDGSDDEIWVSQKLFMLASTIIFSMLFLYYGNNWLAKAWKFTELGKLRLFVNPKVIVPSRVSSILSLITCRSRLDRNDSNLNLVYSISTAGRK